ELPNGVDADLGQPCLGSRANAPHQLDRQIMKEVQFGLWIDNHQTVGFSHLRGNLRQMLVAGHTDRDGKTDLCPHTAPYLNCNISGLTEKVGAPHNVGKCLVDGNAFDQRSEIIEHVDGSITQPLVFLEMATDKDQLWTKLTSPPARHAA